MLLAVGATHPMAATAPHPSPPHPWLAAPPCPPPPLTRALPEPELLAAIGDALARSGLLADGRSPFAAAVAGLLKGSVDVLGDASRQAEALLSYPLADTLAGADAAAVRVPRVVALGSG